ncbi:MAG: PilZ domain-containing protein [Oligoflexia bacterium]|nr:PilZ domain-containing protein [Oligoflexia bacterium]
MDSSNIDFGSNKFSNIKDIKKIRETMEEIYLQSMMVSIFKVLPTEKVVIDASIYSLRKDANKVIKSIVVDCHLALGAEKLHAMTGYASGTNKMQFGLFIPARNILFQSSVLSVVDGVEAKMFEFYLPDTIMQLERRKYVRLQINELMKPIQVIMAKESKNCHFNCYDVSANGLSFLISDSEIKYFHKEESIANMKLIFTGFDQEILLDARVVNLVPVKMKNGQQYKVCMQFIKISNNNKEWINWFVVKNMFTQTEMELMRFSV